jgi:hypothetical protein
MNKAGLKGEGAVVTRAGQISREKPALHAAEALCAQIVDTALDRACLQDPLTKRAFTRAATKLKAV